MLGTLEQVARAAPRPYRFVVLSDHGQSQGATFLQRYGVRLEDVVRQLMCTEADAMAATHEDEQWGRVNALLTEVTAEGGMAGGVTGRIQRRRPPEEGPSAATR